MLPELASGDFIVATQLYRKIRVNDLLVINHPVYHRIIKRVTKVSVNKGICVAGDNVQSISSTQIGWVTRTQVQGKVLFCIKQA